MEQALNDYDQPQQGSLGQGKSQNEQENAEIELGKAGGEVANENSVKSEGIIELKFDDMKLDKNFRKNKILLRMWIGLVIASFVIFAIFATLNGLLMIYCTLDTKQSVLRFYFGGLKRGDYMWWTIIGVLYLLHQYSLVHMRKFCLGSIEYKLKEIKVHSPLILMTSGYLVSIAWFIVILVSETKLEVEFELLLSMTLAIIFYTALISAQLETFERMSRGNNKCWDLIYQIMVVNAIGLLAGWNIFITGSAISTYYGQGSHMKIMVHLKMETPKSQVFKNLSVYTIVFAIHTVIDFALSCISLATFTPYIAFIYGLVILKLEAKELSLAEGKWIDALAAFNIIAMLVKVAWNGGKYIYDRFLKKK